MSAPERGPERADALVVGGGFYGACIALLLKSRLDRVVLAEKEPDLLLRASSANQARVHTGFHYPRSLLTAYRSLVNFPRFVLDFRRAVVDDFTKLYAVARHGSKVNARRFLGMFRQMGAPIEPAGAAHRALFSPELIEEVFQVREVAFDASVLREILRDKLAEAGVETLPDTEIAGVRRAPDGLLAAAVDGRAWRAGMVFNCAYSRINLLLQASGLPLLPLKHELTEMALVELPPEIAGVAVTVMDGPFFSVMPYPSLGLHTLSHVRYTPHMSWTDGPDVPDGHALLRDAPPDSNYPYMIRDAARYLPVLREARQKDSIFEIKTVLTRNETDDGRPILFSQDHGLPGLHVVMGGKIDNIYDIVDCLAEAKASLGLAPGCLGRLLGSTPKDRA